VQGAPGPELLPPPLEPLPEPPEADPLLEPVKLIVGPLSSPAVEDGLTANVLFGGGDPPHPPEADPTASTKRETAARRDGPRRFM
jgi:hypothetical protein